MNSTMKMNSPEFYDIDSIFWLQESAKHEVFVLNTIVETSRNVKGLPFVSTCSDDQCAEIREKVFSAMLQNEYFNQWYSFDQKAQTEENTYPLVEAELLPSAYIEKLDNKAFLMNPDFSTLVYLNEREHIKIRSVDPGSQLDVPYHRNLLVENFLELHCPFAFDERYGYLTSNILDVGTGLKIWIHLHVPMILKNQDISSVLSHLEQYGAGLFPVMIEGRNIPGNLTLSNLYSLGVREKDVISNLTNALEYLFDLEMSLRESCFLKRKLFYEDLIYRAYGRIKNARLLSYPELLEDLTWLRLGIERGYYPYLDYKLLDRLSVLGKAYNLQLFYNEPLNGQKEMQARAIVMKQELENWEQ